MPLRSTASAAVAARTGTAIPSPLFLVVDDGPDVEQLERALRRLVHGSALTVDGTFTRQTANAVRTWQRDNGLERTGRVDATRIPPLTWR